MSDYYHKYYSESPSLHINNVMPEIEELHHTFEYDPPKFLAMEQGAEFSSPELGQYGSKTIDPSVYKGILAKIAGGIAEEYPKPVYPQLAGIIAELGLSKPIYPLHEYFPAAQAAPATQAVQAEVQEVLDVAPEASDTQTPTKRPAKTQSEVAAFLYRQGRGLRNEGKVSGIAMEQAAESMEANGYACAAPKFEKQVNDAMRVTPFGHEVSGPGEMTEHEGLVDLRNFLTSHSHDQRATGMLENLTFIGTKEYAEAAEGIAAYWKQYLNSDPEAQLCPLTLISRATGMNKSDNLLLERVLDHFSLEELEHYAGRLLVEANDLTAPADKVRIVLLDDWVVSGSQMRHAYQVLTNMAANKPQIAEYVNAGRVEINVLAASARRMELGLHEDINNQRVNLPVKAYFLAHRAPASSKYDQNQAHITGVHSSVDYDFHETLDAIRFADPQGPSRPAIGAITRKYRSLLRPNYQRVQQMTHRSE